MDEDDQTIVLSPDDSAEPGSTARDIASKIPALALGGQLLSALEHCHRALRADSCDNELRAKLGLVKEEIERSLEVQGALTLTSAGRRFHVLGGDDYHLGRVSANSVAQIQIPCRWFSRGEKNLRIRFENKRWTVEDIGSTNGHFVDGKKLAYGEPFVLSSDATRIEVGRTDSTPAPAWLHLRVGADNALAIEFGTTGETDHSDIWILTANEIVMGTGTTGSSMTSAFSPGAEARLVFEKTHFRIVPGRGGAVSVGGVPFEEALPIPEKVDLELGSEVFRVERLVQPGAKTENLAATA